MSNTSKVIAMANPPSLNASKRALGIAAHYEANPASVGG